MVAWVVLPEVWHDGLVHETAQPQDHPQPDDALQEQEERDGDELREACGVFGVYAPGRPVAYLTYDGLYALQHRGQESAGMAVSDGEHVTVVRDMGLVSNVFDERTLKPLTGDLAIGHTRYSTTGSSTWRNAQPVFRPGPDGSGFALGHNGNLTNTGVLAEQAGMLPGTIGSDSDLVVELLANAADSEGASLEQAMTTVLPSLEGAYSFVAMDAKCIIGVRDPNGFRPLCLGRLENGWALASETPALDVIGAHFVREIEPGEMVIIDETGIRSVRPYPEDRINPKLCVFEFVYLSRPDTQLYGKEVHGARRRMGELLAEQAPLPPSDKFFDRPAMVMGVPESGVPAAEGFAQRSGIPLGQGLVKNRYIGRTFIAPSQEARAVGVRRKFNPLRGNIVGKRLIVVDDSVIRGTTSRQLVNMLREAGAVEVHLRLSSPPYKWPCFFGIDTGTRAELLAANLDLEEMRQYLGVDSLGFLSLANLKSAIAAPGAGLCDACLTGDYPVQVPLNLNKSILEDVATGDSVQIQGSSQGNS
jgi:amidophosphoribosyltransferase